ncbi:MAG: major capsid protein [Gammaproteobacteria bacterium]|nr:major capsid protein [Gammaproteobacteria bacterium]
MKFASLPKGVIDLSDSVDFALSPSGARVGENPILTSVMRGYSNPMLVHEHLFPVVPVTQRGGKIIQFGDEALAKRELRRAVGAEMQFLQFGYEGEPYALEQRALGILVPREIQEEAMTAAQIDMASTGVRMAMENVLLQIEIEAATLATTLSNYNAGHKLTLTGEAQWSHAKSKPAEAVEAAKQAIKDAILRVPNTLVVGGQVHRKLRNNPDVIERLKHTPRARQASPVTKEELAEYFDVEHYVVGEAGYGAAGAFTECWGNNAVLAFTERGTPAMPMPSYGYCYRLEGYPLVEPSFEIEARRSRVFPAITEDTPVIAAADAGYLFSSVVA